MIIFDAHNDLLTKLVETKGKMFKNSCHIDFDRMLKNKDFTYILGCAIFLDDFNSTKNFEMANEIIDAFSIEMQNYQQFAGLLDAEKIISMILTLEGGRCLLGDPSKVDYFWNKGVRSISLPGIHQMSFQVVVMTKMKD